MLTLTKSNFAFGLLVTSIIIRLILSNPTLDYFYPYTAEGGSPILKIHPGTWIMMLGSLLFFLSRGPSRFLTDQIRSNKYILHGTLGLFAIIFISLIRFGTSGIAYLVDTYLYAYLCVFLITYLNKNHLIKTFNTLLTLIAINCIIAIYESITQSTIALAPIQFGFFRANAILGHPLNNALITITLGLLAFNFPIRPWLKSAFFAIIVLSLLAYGARAASGIFLLTCFVYFGIKPFIDQGHLAQSLIKHFSILAISILITAYLIFSTSIGSTIASRIMLDDSVLARVEALSIFSGLTFSDFLWGVGSTGITEMTERYMTVSIIENFWIYTLLQFGIVILAILYTPLLFAAFKYVRQGNALSWVLSFAFFATASSNNALSVKTPALAIFLISIFFLSRYKPISMPRRNPFKAPRKFLSRSYPTPPISTHKN